MPADDSLTPFREAAQAFSDLRTRAQRRPGRAPGDGEDGAPLLPPEYRLEALIAETRLSRTWRAFHTEHQAHVVVKELHPRLLLEPEALERFRLEVQLISRFAHLAHRNIVPVLATHLAEPPYFFSMPLIDGEHLDTYCLAHALDLRQRVELFLRVCRGVAHAHRAGVIHRDLKPNNIIVDRDGEPQLLDFGLAREQLTTSPADTAEPRPMYGALAYMAPEQTEGLPGDVATDIYALGGILYELLTGRRPIESAAALDEYVARIRTARPAPLRTLAPAISPELEAVVLRCLEKAPADRYGSVNELAADLECCLAGRPISIWRTRGRYVVARFLRRNRLRVAVVAALALLVATLGGFEMKRQQRFALARVQAETQRHMRVVSHARLLTNRESPAAALNLLRGELSRHDDLRTRFALWELHRKFPCIGHYPADDRLVDVVFADDYWIVALSRTGALLARAAKVGADDWTSLEMPSAAACIAAGTRGDAFYAATPAGAVYAFQRGTARAPPTLGRPVLSPGQCSGTVTRLAVSPDGNRIAIVSTFGDVWITSTGTGTAPAVPVGSHFFEQVAALAFSPDGCTLALAGQPAGLPLAAGAAQLVDVLTGKEHGTRSTGQVRALAFAPDGQTLFIGDEHVWAWHIQSDVIEPLPDDLKWGVRSAIVSAAAPYPWLAYAAGDGRIQFVGLPDEGPWPMHGYHDTAVADEVRLAASPGGGLAASIAQDGLRLWDVYPARRTPISPDGTTDWRLLRIALDDTSDTIAAAADHVDAPRETLRVTRVLSAGPACGVLRTIAQTCPPDPADCCALARNTLAYARLDSDAMRPAIAVLDLDRPECRPCAVTTASRTISLAWLDVTRGELLAGTDDGRIVLYRYDRPGVTIVAVATLATTAPGATCNAITVSSDRCWLAATTEDSREVHLWRIRAARDAGDDRPLTLGPISRTRVDFPPWQVAIVADQGRPLLVASGAAQSVVVLDGLTGRQRGQLIGHRDSVDHCAALSDTVIVTASRDGHVIAWDPRTLEELAVLHRTRSGHARISARPGRLAIATNLGITVADASEATLAALLAGIGPKATPR